jgi:hypothetical protein
MIRIGAGPLQECANSKSRRKGKQCCRSQKIQVIAERIQAVLTSLFLPVRRKSACRASQ